MRRTYRIAPELLEGRRLPSSLVIPTQPPALVAPCDSGDDPPVIQPTLPGSGPGGPGTSS